MILPKQIVLTKMPFSPLPDTTSVLLVFFKKTFCTHPKTLFCLVSFVVLLSCFFCVCLSPTQKSQKHKVRVSFLKPHFRHANMFWKTLPLHPYTLSVILNIPKNTINWGKHNPKHLGPNVGAKFGPDIHSRHPNLGPDADSTIYIYTYTYTHTYSCGDIIWPKFGALRV